MSPRRSPRKLLEEVYSDDYWHSSRPRERGYADYARDAELHERTFERRWKALRWQLPLTGKALDVGCATGSFLGILQRQGWSVQGLEPSRAMAAVARERLGAESLQESTLEGADLDGRQFDLITLWDVLEHLPRPLVDLQRVRDLLSPGGRVIIETQDISSLMARVCGSRWQHFKHDEHLLHFTPETLEAACRSAGFRVLDCGRRAAGKYVRGSFLVERSGRIHPRLPKLLHPILGGSWAVYVNPLDELIAVLEAAR